MASGVKTVTTLPAGALFTVDTGGPVFDQVALSTMANYFQGGGGGGTTWSVFGATPTTQPASADQAAITDSSGGTAAPTTGVAVTLATQTFLIPITMASLANAQTFAIDPGFAGSLKSINYRNTAPVTSGSKAATITASVNGSAPTGGAIALAGTYAVGAAQAGSAVSGAVTFTAAQTIGFAVSAVTAFVEGSGVIELTVVNSNLNNAIATIVAENNAIRSALVTLGIIKGAA